MSDRIFQLILIDNDPIFRLGLRMALEPFPNLQILAEADSAATALEILAEYAGTENAVDLLILELNLGCSDSQQLTSLELCQQIKNQYHKLPILLLSSPVAPDYLIAAQQASVDGYCAKGTEILVLVQAIRQLVSGKTYWTELPIQDLIEIEYQPSIVTNQSRSLNWHHRLRQSGLQQINDSLTEVTSILQNPALSIVDWLFWSGRKRELLAARWLVNQLLPTNIIVVTPRSSRSSQSAGNLPEDFRLLPEAALGESTALSIRPQQSSLFNTTKAKLQLGIQNLTGSPLEIDILRDEKKRELLQIILRQLEEVLNELRASEIQPPQLSQKLSAVLRDLWQTSLTNFFGKYYTLSLGNREYEVVEVLLQDGTIIQDAILNKIPLVTDLFLYLLFQAPLIINNAVYSAETFEALERAEKLLENLIIQVSNAVMQPMLNNFADNETIKQSFYNPRLISTRDITRFRNNLSWQYRWKQYIDEPRAIFESRYNIWVLSSTGIKKIFIYAPRRQELEQLTGIQLAVTLALEVRDAIAPRLQAIVSFLGTGVIYLLTQVIGRGIGLIGRGIIQGIGNTLQDTRFGKNSERQKPR